MIKFCGIIILMVFAVTFQVHAQSVAPLMRDASLKTYVTLPYRLLNVQGSAQDIIDAKITSNSPSCQIMIDPFIAANFLIKCTEPSTVNVAVYYYLNNSYTRINYGPISIVKLTDAVVSTPVGNGPSYAVGQQLYVTHCIQCHTPIDKQNKSAAQIKSAILSKPQMQNIVLTNEQVQAIADYLGHL
jgi:hypothetical protein